jgi:2-polyprenyl-3-methyl-5-hydroxy-6-metoxy-1,4-benzoquinol methylase
LPYDYFMKRVNDVISPACIVCGGADWLSFPASESSRSVRSDGTILSNAIKKAQCATCGLVQSVDVPDQGELALLYREAYDIYNNRPASEQFITGRYTALAQAITSSVAPFRPHQVLEVGCGNGSALEAVQAVWDTADCRGVEPTVSAVHVAAARGLKVFQGMIGGVLPDEIGGREYDVVYSIHVIEHTENPIDYLGDLKDMLAPRARLIITCPNARTPNLEIMRTDHHYSMTPYHLNVLARKAGLLPIKNTLCPGGDEGLDYEHNQLLVCCLPGSQSVGATVPLPDYLSAAGQMRLFEARSKYFHAFDTLDDRLQPRLEGLHNLYCFGAGGWASMLAGYAPRTWSQVKACVIDGGADVTFCGKAILPYSALADTKADAVLVGVNPASQLQIAHRLDVDGWNSIRWVDIIEV